MSKRFEIVQRLETLKDYCKGKRVLHLGCTNSPYTELSIANGSILHLELESVAGELYGFDYDRKSIDILKACGSKNIYFADLEHLEDVDLEMTFDVIIAGEIIEHLSNPGLFLKGIQRFMSPETMLVITTINAYCAMRFFHYGLTRRYGRNEPVHPDHVAYYSYSTLNLMIKRHDLDVVKFMFYDLGNEHKHFTPMLFKIINLIAVWFARQYSDGVIAVCRLKVTSQKDLRAASRLLDPDIK
jgi:ubiquinone/menaquinone biosynthesis C-methylase UbiE